MHSQLLLVPIIYIGACSSGAADKPATGTSDEGEGGG